MVNPEKFKEILSSLEDEDGSRARRRDFAEAVNVLARSTKASTIVEVGSSSGYISLWLALAAASNNATLYIFDDDKSRLDKVREMMNTIGFDNVEFHDTVPSENTALPSEIGFLVLDHDLEKHLSYLQICLPNIPVGGMIVTDNAIAGFAELRAYINEVRMGKYTSSVMFPLGEGLEVTTKSADNDPLNQLYTDLIR